MSQGRELAKHLSSPECSWLLLLQKPTDLDLHCLQRQGISGFSRTRVKIFVFLHGNLFSGLNKPNEIQEHMFYKKKKKRKKNVIFIS